MTYRKILKLETKVLKPKLHQQTNLHFTITAVLVQQCTNTLAQVSSGCQGPL